MTAHMRKNDCAVSPVVGVILMVAITVVMSGIVYFWATQLTDTQDTTVPYYMFDINLNSENDEILIIPKNGLPLLTDNLILRIDGNEVEMPSLELRSGVCTNFKSPV